MSADDRAVGAPERLHPMFLLGGLGGSLRGMIGAYAGLGYIAATGRLSTALIGALVLLLFLAAGIFLYWRRFEYRVGEAEIRIDSGIVSRTHRSIPFDRVQDVDITQGPLARLLGLAKVRFETGSSAAGTSEEGVLHAIALERAEDLRALVRARRADTAQEAPAEAGAERPPVYAMDLKRLLLAGLFNFSLAVFAGLFGLTQTAGDLIGFDPFNRDFWESLLVAGGPIATFLLANRVATIIAGLLSLVLIGIATGIIRTTLRDYRFRLDRTETGLRRRRGLFTLTDVTLPVRRAQAAIVGTGPIRERFGWRELKLQSLAKDEGGKGDHLLAPLATEGEVAEIVEQLGWRRLPADVAWTRVSRAHVWTLAIGLSPLVLVALAQMVLMPLLGVGLILLLAAAVGLRWLAWRRTGYAIDGDRLLIRTGWWRRIVLLLPLRRIQSADIAHSFISRWFGISSLVIGVAGGSGFSAHSIPALPIETARQIREELLSGAA